MMFIPVELPQKQRTLQVMEETAEPVRKPVIETKAPIAKTLEPPSPKKTEPVAAESAAERRCPKCNAIVPAGKRFCTNDGTRIPD
jgi:hypothetical protein